MEYKYHPIIKYLTFFVIVYLFLRHQNLMKNEILLANTLVITMYYIVLDYLFISQHQNIFLNESDQYFDVNEINSIKEDIEKEKKIKCESVGFHFPSLHSLATDIMIYRVRKRAYQWK